ncbi:MAG: alpha/beta hydrolase [Selenomonadaceae bacterium]|nr:alpha/beta hydrolase [Selenomonadaceae bacterium]
MKKFLLTGILTTALLINNSTDAARYFTQGDKLGSSTPYGDNVKIGKYVQADDAKIYYEVYGAGEPILILHGGGVGTPYELGKILDELKKSHKLIVMSTRGHGRSEIGHTPLTYKQKAEDALAVLDDLKISAPVQILGFSDGAYTAYEIAALYPEKVERIMAIGAGTLKAGYFPSDMSLADLEKFDKRFIDGQKKIRPEPERWQEFLSDYMKFWSSQSVGAETFGKIKCPVLLIVGDEDDHAPVITVLAAHQMIENSRLCVVPKAWHTAFLDNYDVTSTAIFQFVNTPLENLKPSKKVDYNSKVLEVVK